MKIIFGLWMLYLTCFAAAEEELEDKVESFCEAISVVYCRKPLIDSICRKKCNYVEPRDSVVVSGICNIDGICKNEQGRLRCAKTCADYNEDNQDEAVTFCKNLKAKIDSKKLTPMACRRPITRTMCRKTCHFSDCKDTATPKSICQLADKSICDTVEGKYLCMKTCGVC